MPTSLQKATKEITDELKSDTNWRKKAIVILLFAVLFLPFAIYDLKNNLDIRITVFYTSAVLIISLMVLHRISK